MGTAPRSNASRRCAGALLVCLLLGGCTTRIDPLSPSLETLRLLRENSVAVMALGRFTSASKDIRNSVTIRLSAMKAPKGRSFAEFLAATFETELVAAGKLDAASPLVLEGILTESRVGEDMAKGEASLGATIRLRRSGVIIFSRPYRVETRWKSDFIGALAIPEAFRQYNSLYALLVREALSDPDLIEAARQR